MKKSIALILCILSMICTIPFPASAAVFDDVPEGKWYSEGIEFCYENGYMAGVSEKIFDRGGTLTRAMFVTILASLDKADTADYGNKSNFTDVLPGKWYSGAVNWAFENGLASGLGEGIFGYKNPVTREQIAVFMLAYAEFSNKTHPERNPFDITARADLSDFDDAERIHSWALDGVRWAVALSLISGTSESALDPRGLCTRAQAAVIIHSFMQDIEKKECEHIWEAPTCSSDGFCSICGEKGESALGHEWIAPDCVNDSYCSRCNEKGESALGHEWIAPDCLSDGYCSVCGKNSESAVGHDMIAPDCQNDGYCSRCNEKGESALGHEWIVPDCVNDGYCSRCNEKGESAFGHNYITDEDDSQFKSCEICGDMTCAIEHLWIDATCTKDGYCALCKDFYESAKGHEIDEYDTCIHCGGTYDPIAGCFHEWIMPDCYNDGYCTVCGMKGEMSDGHEFENGECNYCGMKLCKHKWADPNCTMPRHCTLCPETDDSFPALGHDYSSGNTGCKRCGILHSPSLSAHMNVLQNLAIRGTNLSENRKGFTSSAVSGQAESSASLYMIANNYTSIFSSLINYDSSEDRYTTITLELKDNTQEYELKIESDIAGVPDFSIVAILNPKTLPENGVTVTDLIFAGEQSEAELAEIANSSALLIVESTETMLKTNTNVSLSDYS